MSFSIVLANSSDRFLKPSSKWEDDNRMDEDVDNEDMDAKIVCPGELITSDPIYMRGHGTYIATTGSSELQASICGRVEYVNRLVSVRALRTRYVGEVGDVVVGRVMSLGTKKWRIDVNSRLEASLQLSAVNLPGGELRRRSEEDERDMRKYLVEGDLISAEVQSVASDGRLSLHTRSLKYGKLGQGMLVRVPSNLVKRQKNHFLSLHLSCEASLIMGNNGYIWVAPLVSEEMEQGGFKQSQEPAADEEREAMIRLRNCIMALAKQNMALYDTTIIYAYEASVNHNPLNVVRPDISREIANAVKQRMAVS